MSKSVEEARRELFEAAITLPQTVKWCNEQKKYIGQNFWLADYAFEAWNAALDSVVVELPKKYGQHSIVAHASFEQFNIGVDQSRAAIESTSLGIKIK